MLSVGSTSLLISNMNIQLLFTFVFIIKTFAADLKRGDPCTTPNNENATCTPLSACKVIFKAISTFNPEALKFAQESQCGNDEEGLVCCGSSAYKQIDINLLCTQKRTKIFTPPPPVDKLFLSPFSDYDCVEPNPSYRIKKGSLVQPKEFPWMAALEYESRYDNKSRGIRCIGSLISIKYVLTAAHCIIHKEFVVIKAWLGLTNLTSERNCLNLTGNVQCADPVQKFSIVRRIPHELYNGSHGCNDVGLLKLETLVTSTNYIRPICLPSEETPSPENGSRLIVAGWGYTDDNSTFKIKLKVDAPVVLDNICNKILETKQRTISPGELCASGENGNDSCRGYSGGPVMKAFISENGDVSWYQEGLVSYRDGCGDDEHPAIYPRVSKYMTWIIDKITFPLPEHPSIVSLQGGGLG